MQRTLEELLIESKLVSPPQLATAQREAELRRRPLARTLIDLGFVSDRAFAQWVSNITRLPVVDPLRPEAVAELATRIPATLAREYQVVPLSVNGGMMTVAIANPLDRTSLDTLQSVTRMKIQPVVALHTQVAQMVDRMYPAPPPFDFSATVSVSEVGPFDVGNGTVLRAHTKDSPIEQEDSVGSETRMLPTAGAPAATAPLPRTEAAADGGTAQLDRIERSLAEVAAMVERLSRRIDAIDSTLARVLNRQR